MKKVAFVFIMLSFISYGRSQTLELASNDMSAENSAFLVDSQNEADVLNDSVFMQDIANALLEGSINNDILTKDPNKIAAGVLNILLGDIGVGHFYTGQIARGVLDILFCWTGVPALIGLIEGVIWLCEDDDAWAERVAKWNN